MCQIPTNFKCLIHRHSSQDTFVAECTLPSIFTKIFLQSTVYIYQRILLTPTFHFSPDTLALRHTISETCAFYQDECGKFLFCQNLNLSLNTLESLYPGSAAPDALSSNKLFSTKIIRHLKCVKALRAYNCTQLQSLNLFLISINSPLPHPVPTWLISTPSPGDVPALYLLN